MKNVIAILLIIITASGFAFTFKDTLAYRNCYTKGIQDFTDQEQHLLQTIRTTSLAGQADRQLVKDQIDQVRLSLKANDFWLRYLEPVLYQKINGALSVEWETEVFEKFEKPYKRTGAGLSLAELYLKQSSVNKDSLLNLIDSSIAASGGFAADSITKSLVTYHHFFLANRLYLLNLASIYTTGFECPDPKNIIPELRYMLTQVRHTYESFDQSFPATPLSPEYLRLYDQMIDFVDKQPTDFTEFDHFGFIRDYVNALFKMNQQFIISYNVASDSYNDYSLNNSCQSIFDKGLYTAQNIKGMYAPVEDTSALQEIRQTGKLLFYDPILSGNNQRSCASCHKPDQYFTDTAVATSPQFDHQGVLPRNTPSLINAPFNHLLMMDGRQYTLQSQANEVMMSLHEMHSTEKELIRKVMSCKEYKEAFHRFLKLTPEEKEVGIGHITSALTLYYGSFSQFYAPFDEAMNNKRPLPQDVREGFNLFMGKAQCGTCHFVPQFNGVKPPYVNSEFEVLGVPDDLHFASLSQDSGRYVVNAAGEMLHAFRTGTVRNAACTKPYMHNGVFKTLDEVLDFYDAGGGSGKKLMVTNQTLSSDSLKLTIREKQEIISFIQSLNEQITFDIPPQKLPQSTDKALNSRKPGGEY